MFETLKRLYAEGRLTIEQLGNAVVKHWISETQYEDICGEQYVV